LLEGRGLFQGKIAPWSPQSDRGQRGQNRNKVIIAPGQMKLFYRVEGNRWPFHYNGDVSISRARATAAYLGGGTPHGWENLGSRRAQGAWVLMG